MNDLAKDPGYWAPDYATELFDQGYADGQVTVTYWIGEQDKRPTKPPTVATVLERLGRLTDYYHYREGAKYAVAELDRPGYWAAMVENYY